MSEVTIVNPPVDFEILMTNVIPPTTPTPQNTIPPEFDVTDAGLYWIEPGDEGKRLWLSDRLEVLAELRNGDNEDWSKLLAFTDRDGNTHEWVMPMKMLASDYSEIVAMLLGKGLRISTATRDRTLLIRYLNEASSTNRIRQVDQIGWQAEGYLLPDAWFGDNREQFRIRAASESNHAFRIAGTLAEWQAEVAARCVGNSRLAFAVSAAFAAPLLKPLGSDNGGFHFRGGSSIGKTTALLVAASVWGGGSGAGYIKRWRTTDNGLEGIAHAHNDALLVLDEIGQMDAKAVGEAAYLLGNGTAKVRMTKNGETRPTSTWRILFLSSGEVSLADHSKAGGKVIRAGQEVRLINIEADVGRGLGLFETIHGSTSSGEFARTIGEASRTYYGTPIREFLKWLVANEDRAKASVKATQASFVKNNLPDGASGEVERALKRFGLVAAAGELASLAGVLPWTAGEAAQAAKACFDAWLQHRGGCGSADDTAAVAKVRKFIETHGDSRFSRVATQDLDGTQKLHVQPVQSRAGFRWNEKGETRYFFLHEVFKDEVCGGFDHKAVAKALDHHGHLVFNEQERLTYKTKELPQIGRLRGYLVKARILQD